MAQVIFYILSADPLSLDKVVRRVVTSAPSLFPSPRGPKTLQFVLRRSSANGPRALFFELRMAIAFQSRFGTDFGALWDSFCDHFGSQNWFQMALRIDMPTRHQT